MQIYEKGKNVVIEIPALDLDLEDIIVEVSGDSLKINGKKKISKEARKEGYYAKEEKESSFVNEFTLPFKIDETKIKTELRDGILRLVVPRR